jgi:oligo-1,6-glucosidase
MTKWWQDRIAYQIYPRSFQDSNGDGIGDIPGIISRLDELASLGVGILWLSPLYPSPDADNGYDIRDYCAIDAKFGTMADMDKLIAEAEKRDIRIIMDLVINHTSDEHEWFTKSRAGDAEYRDYYIWQPPKGGPPKSGDESKNGAMPKSGEVPKSLIKPNNWTGFFMNEVWEYDEKSGEYYLHLFDKKQPDLNYKNPKVIEEIKKILRFWLDRGIWGFRCDVINIIYKTSLDDGKKNIAVCGIEHFKCQPGNHAVLQELRRDVLSKYDCFTVGETVMVNPAEAKLLCDEARGELDMLFYFEHLEVDRRISRFIPKKFNAAKLLEVITKWQRELEWNAVYLENHDQSRIVSHFGDDGRYWERSAKLLAVFELTLRGTVFIYQGQEIGMTNFSFRNLDELNDVESHNLDSLMQRFHIPAFLRRRWVKASSRDNARTPYQWSGGENAGFTTGKPWLGINDNYTRINHAAQKDNPDSVLNFYRKLIALRLSCETLKKGTFEPLTINGAAAKRLAAYHRTLGGESYTVILNFSSKTASLASIEGASALMSPALQDRPNADNRIIVSNINRTVMDKTLQPWEACVFHTRITFFH